MKLENIVTVTIDSFLLISTKWNFKLILIVKSSTPTILKCQLCLVMSFNNGEKRHTVRNLAYHQQWVILIASTLDTLWWKCYFSSVIIFSQTHKSKSNPDKIISQRPMEKHSSKYVPRTPQNCPSNEKQGKFEKLFEPKENKTVRLNAIWCHVLELEQRRTMVDNLGKFK